jgi:WD40 repeat protein
MVKAKRFLLLTAGLALFLSWPARGNPSAATGPKPSRKAKPVRTDLYGEPLPEGAIARMGKIGLRHSGYVFCVAFSPDGKTLASGGQDKVIRLWETSTGKALRQFVGHVEDVTSIAFSPKGDALVSGSRDKTIRFWDVASGKPRPQIINHPGKVREMAFSRDGKKLASAGGANIYIWDPATAKEVRHWKAHKGGACGLAFSPDGKTLASGGFANSRKGKGLADSYALALWNPATGKMVRCFEEHNATVWSVAFSPDGKMLASTGCNNNEFGSTIFWDPATGKKLRQIGGRLLGTYPNCIAFSPTGQTVVIADESSLQYWNLAKKDMLRSMGAGMVYAAVFSPDGRTLAIADGGKSVTLWDLGWWEDYFAPQTHRGSITSLAIAPDSKTVLTASYGRPRFWEIGSGKLLRPYKKWGWTTGIKSMAVSPDGRTLALVTTSRITLWDFAKEKFLGAIRHGSDVAIAFSPDSKFLVSAASDRRDLCLWEVATGKEIRQYKKFEMGGASVAYSPDGQTIASAGAGLYVWEAATGKVIRHWQGEKGARTALAPDAMIVVMANKKVRVRELITGRELYQLNTPAEDTYTFAFSPDGRLLATVSGNAVKLWDVLTGAQVRVYKGHWGMVTALGFSADGKVLVSGNGTALVWDVSEVLSSDKEPDVLKPHQLTQHWNDLKSADPLKAYRAFRTLLRAPAPSVAFLQKELRPVKGFAQKRIERWITELDSEKFKVRRKATAELEKLAELAEPALRKTLAKKPSVEVRGRIDRLLAKVPRSLEAKRACCVVKLLENVGTPEAQQLLTKVARGTPAARLTQEAKAVLERLATRTAAEP